MTDAQSEWARCKEWIAAAIKPCGLFEIEDIEQLIADGFMHFWPGKQCAAVTEFLPYPSCKVLNIFAGGGTRGKALRELLQMERDLEAWGRDHGCTRSFIFGINEGTRRVGERHGYTHLWTVMSKEL